MSKSHAPAAPVPDAEVSPPPLAGPDETPEAPERRTFLGTASSIAMTGGLVAGYGAFGAMAARYLYPAKPPETAWLFVADLAHVKKGDAIPYRTPAGATVVIARQGDAGTDQDFIALSSTCPHLGCQVRWEGQNDRYFCPCHNGTFNTEGIATGGPPGDAGQALPRYGLVVDKGLLYIMVPAEQLSMGDVAGVVEVTSPVGPGHDPCLTCVQARTPGPGSWGRPA